MTSSITGVDRGALTRSEDAVLKSAIDAEAPVAGVVAMVTDRSGNIYEGAAGKRRIDGDAAITTDDVFALFSTTKAITATAALQLVEEGQLDLDRPASDYAPEIGELQVIEGFDDDGAPRLRHRSRFRRRGNSSLTPEVSDTTSSMRSTPGSPTSRASRV